MKIVLSDVSSMIIAHDVFKHLNDNLMIETCGVPDGMIIENIGEIIKEKVNECLNEFNNDGVIL